MKKKLKIRIFCLPGVSTKIAIFCFLFLLPIFSAQASEITVEKVIELVNAERLSNNLDILKENKILDKAAEYKLNDMIENNYFAHTSPQGSTPWSWIEKSGYDYKYAGENLAINFTSAENQHRAWMASPTHRKNILNANYREIGIATGKGKIDGENSILTVQMFGTDMASYAENKSNPVPVVQKNPVQAVQGEQVMPEKNQTGESKWFADIYKPADVLPVKYEQINLINPVCNNGICRFENAGSKINSMSGKKLPQETAWILVILVLIMAVSVNTLTLARYHRNNPFIAANTVVLIMVLTSMIMWQV